MKETDMLNAWLWEKHRDDLQWPRARLGQLPTKELARMYSVILRWADAIVVSNGVVEIIEAKLRPAPGAIGQLELYEKLFRNTHRFKSYWGWPIKKVLLTSYLDANMVEMCSDKGIRYEVFSEEDVNEVRKRLKLPQV